MKIQSLAIIFIIILITISVALSIYTETQIKALNLESQYDSKLQSATYDAIQAFQINTSNNTLSDISDSKLSNILASVNTFYESIDSSFRVNGYTSDNLKDFVPALVYTMYDGYYIYSPYNNVAQTVTVSDDEKGTKDIIQINPEVANNIQYGIKPYIYYSCRYKRNNDDFVITYSLDNYITIKGKVNGKYINDSGYLLTGEYEYNNNERLSEYVICEGTEGIYSYAKLNGTKYYLDESVKEIFYLLNGKRTVQVSSNTNLELYNKYLSVITNNNLAQKYYKEAKEFTDRILNDYNLKNLEAKSAVDSEGKSIDLSNGTYKYIFKQDNVADKTELEYYNSNFNKQRQAVIRNSIESNLSVAIAGFNSYSGVSNNFQMPKLKETEWDLIANNVSLISFMQGLNIGTKIYNGYSVISNTETEELIRPEDIYILSSDDNYHKVTCSHLIYEDITLGVLDLDLRLKSSNNGIETIKYYPRPQIAAYDCIVSNEDSNLYEDIYQYLDNLTNNNAEQLKKLYYTALGRERAGQYKTETILNIDDYIIY